MSPTQEVPRPELPEGYYVDNFERILGTVQERYGDLLLAAEQAFAARFGCLSLGGRRLFVRLVSRKGPCFRRDRLRYPEIPSLDLAVAELERVALLDRAEDAGLLDVLSLFVVRELSELAGEMSIPRSGVAMRRPELMEALLEQADSEALREAIDRRIEVVRPLGLEHILAFRLLFFGNFGQDLTELVLRDLGVVRYEAYELSREQRLFDSRQAVDDNLWLRGIRQQISELWSEGELAEAVEIGRQLLCRRELLHPSTSRHCDRTLNHLARDLERESELEQALELYCLEAAPPARERRSRVLAQLGREQDALALCREIRRKPRDETEVGFAKFFEHRLRRRLGLTRESWRRPERPKRVIELERRPAIAVEQQVLAALLAGGQPGVHSENWLWRSLFGLAFWDIVFAPVPGAFHNPFQLGPLDLYESDFRLRRSALVEKRMAELREQADLADRLLAVYEAKFGIANRLVSWHPDLEPGLRLALEHLRGEQLATICDRLSRDLGRYRRGLPDLFLVSPQSPVGFELLEVKAPGDQLRAEQATWIDFLNQHGIPASVLQVRWLEESSSGPTLSTRHDLRPMISR